jgi:Sigma-70, region 4
LIAVASRRLIDIVRTDQARRDREDLAAARELTPAAESSSEDDSLALLFLCCHPVLTPSSAIPLTLRAVGGLTTAEIATAFLVPEDTMAKRISRAKQRIKTSGIPFRMPTQAEWTERLRTVLHGLYLIFNEGYAASTGPRVARVELSAEAIRLTRALRAALPDDAEVAPRWPACSPSCSSPRPAAPPVPDGMANSYHSPSKIGLNGIGRSSPRVLPCCTRSCLGERSASTNCRPRSPPSTTKPRPPTRLTGHRSWFSMACSST